MLLPPLDTAQAAEVAAIYSVAGLIGSPGEPLSQPPWRSPHHTTALQAMLAGGTGIIRPGEAALAHHGVLFLHQAPEFGRDVLTALHQPLASGHVTVARAGMTTRFPARFTLIAGLTPCPCGAAGGCGCTPLQARRYAARVNSGLGSHVSLRLTAGSPGTPSRARADQIAWQAQVADARDRARHRLRGAPWRLNADIPGPELARNWRPEADAIAEVTRAVEFGQTSRRTASQVIRVAWTLADLAGTPEPGATECQQALAFQLGTSL